MKRFLKSLWLLLFTGLSGSAVGEIIIVDFERPVGRQGEVGVTYTGNLSGGPSYAYDSIVSVDLGNPAPSSSTADLGSGITLEISGPGQHGTWTANNEGGTYVPDATTDNDALVNGYLWIRDNATFTFTLSGFDPTHTVTLETMESQKDRSIVFEGGPLEAPVTTNQLFEADSDNATAFQEIFTTTGSTSYSFTGTQAAGDPQGQVSAFRITVNQASTSPLALEVSHDSGTSMLSFTWPSQPGKVYDLLSSTDPETDGDPETWTVVAEQENIAATPDSNTLTIARPADDTRFYVVREKDAPPPEPVTVFEDDFETDKLWTTDANPGDGANTAWQRGAPVNYLSVAGLPPLTGANGSTNCFGTNLAADYGSDTNIYLRSPAIDLTAGGFTEATLTLWHYLDTDSPFTNDVGAIRVLRAGDFTQLGADLETGLGGIPDNNTDWQPLTSTLPVEALGQTIILEFHFVSDTDEHYSGWYIDDVAVTTK